MKNKNKKNKIKTKRKIKLNHLNFAEMEPNLIFKELTPVEIFIEKKKK